MLEGKSLSKGRTVSSALVGNSDILELELLSEYTCSILANSVLSYLNPPPNTWAKHLVSSYSLTSEETFVKEVYILCILPVKKLRHREAKQLAQGCTSSEWQTQGSSVFTTVACCFFSMRRLCVSL